MQSQPPQYTQAGQPQLVAVAQVARPQHQLGPDGRPILRVQEPDFIAKCCCPVPATYIVEGFGTECLLAWFCGCIYTNFFWEPRGL